MRFAATFAAVAVLAWIALQAVFGVAGGILGLLLSLAWLLLKLLVVGSIVYFVLALVAPDLARKVRERVAGGPSIR